MSHPPKPSTPADSHPINRFLKHVANFFGQAPSAAPALTHLRAIDHELSEAAAGRITPCCGPTNDLARPRRNPPRIKTTK